MAEEILNEYYIKRPCKKKSKTKGGKKASGNCAMISHKTNKQKACYDNCDVARAATHLEEEELGEMRVSTDELPSRKKSTTTPGDLKAAADARMLASFNKAINKQKEKDRLNNKFNKKALEEEEEELEELSSGAGGAAGGYSLPLGEKPSFFHDEIPRLKGTMPGIKLIYKRREKGN